MSDFFNALRKQAVTKATREFDRGFWKKFDTEFSPPRRKFQWSFNFGLRMPGMPFMSAFATAVALVIATGLLWNVRTTHLNAPIASTELSGMAVAENQDMLARMEMLKAFDSIPGGLPVSDEDWDILLPEGVPS